MQTPLVYLKGVGPDRARLLKEELQLVTFQDLLHFFQTVTSIEVGFTVLENCQERMLKYKSKGRLHPLILLLKRGENGWLLSLKTRLGVWN